MFATGSAPFAGSQYPKAMQSNVTGTLPAASATASRPQAGRSMSGEVVGTATTTTTPTDAAANTIAESARAAMRAPAPTGNVRTYVSHGRARSVAIPTPNWKNATLRTA